MKNSLMTLCAFAMLVIISCGPNADEKAKQQKEREDSLVDVALKDKEKQNLKEFSNKINDLQKDLTKAEEDLNGLNNDPNYLYIKSRLATVRARVSTGGSYGWIDKDGKFWSGKDASKAFDEAAASEKSQLEKIEAKNSEIKIIQDKIKDIEDLKN